MVVFEGYLSGAAKYYYRRRAEALGRKILLFAMLALLPAIVIFASWLKSWGMLLGYIAIYFAVPPIVALCRREKDWVALTPQKIIAEDDYLVCLADKCTESKAIADVKMVRAFDEFYEIVFPFGNYSEKFICQKDLLVKGTLEEFEALFEGKIERK